MLCGLATFGWRSVEYRLCGLWSAEQNGGIGIRQKAAIE